MMGAPHEPGIVPLAVAAIFDHIEATQDREFLLRVSYMEVRAAGCRLALHPGLHPSCIRRHARASAVMHIIVQPLEPHYVRCSATECLWVLFTCS